MDNTQLGIIIGSVIALLGGVAVFVRSMVNRTLSSHESQTKALVEGQEKTTVSIEKVASGVHELNVTMVRMETKIDSIREPLRVVARVDSNR